MSDTTDRRHFLKTTIGAGLGAAVGAVPGGRRLAVASRTAGRRADAPRGTAD